MKTPNNLEANIDDIKSWQVKSFLEIREIWDKIISSPHFSISKNEILQIVKRNRDGDITDYSINKLIERINEKFRLLFNLSNEDYKYDRSLKRYVLNQTVVTDSNLPPYNVLYDYLTATVIANKLDDFDSRQISKAFKFKFKDLSTNIPQIFMLIRAIEEKKVIRFKHHNYFNNVICSHSIEPWFIKPDQDKFFLGGYRLKKNNSSDEGYRHFTISQIIPNSIEILDEPISKDRKNQIFEGLEFSLFNKCIGVRMFREDKPAEKCLNATIIIETDFTTGKEWLNNPKHTNQICTKEGNQIGDKFLFEFKDFYFNNRFKNLILGSGSSVKIVGPKEAQEELKTELEKMIKQYS